MLTSITTTGGHHVQFTIVLMRKPFRWLAGLLVAALAGSSAAMIGASPASALTYHRWVVDANEVKVADAQEENWWWDNGDEVQLGVIAFRTVLGSPGTTSAWYVGNDLRDALPSGADDGQVLPDPRQHRSRRLRLRAPERIGLTSPAATTRPSSAPSRWPWKRTRRPTATWRACSGKLGDHHGHRS